jgi:hypothetical protein
MPFIDLIKRPDFHLARQGSLLVALWNGAGSTKDLDLLSQHEHAIAKELGIVTMMSLVPATGTQQKVSDEVRAKSVEVVKLIGKKMAGSATVILGKGLGATMIRTFMTGFNLVSKAPSPQKSFAEVDDALVWLKSLPNQHADLKSVTTAAIVSHFAIDAAKQAA